MSDILLIQPPIRDFYLTAKRTIPYGLTSIASLLLQEGFDVEIIDGLASKKSHIIPLPVEMGYLREYYTESDISPFSLFYHYRHYGYSFEHIGLQARKSGAYLVGISSLFTPYAEEALKVAEVVKRNLPGCKIVMGGHHPTSLPLEVLKHPAVDLVLRGEGEVSMPLLARALKENTPVRTIPGICFLDEQKQPIIKPPALMDNVSAFPPPAFQLINQKYYQRNKRGTTVIMAGRGCPMKCTYCSVSRTSYLSYRTRSLESILEELEMAINRHDARFIDFEDENLSFNRRWFHELLDKIIENFGTVDLELRAMNGLLPSSLDEDLIVKMKQAGFTALNLSLCTIAKPQLERFSRPDVREAFETAVNLAAKHDLVCSGYIIVGAPGQDPADSVKDLLFLADKRVLAGVSAFYPSPGSIEFERCKNRNLLPLRLSLTRSSALPLSDTTTRKEVITLLRLGRILNFMKFLVDTKDQKQEKEKTDIGKHLLEMFFNDGKIRGIDETGKVYEQAASMELTRQFISGLKKIKIKGVH
ncbi:B12-binding domain-containing radical SAM protein [bacterium]|nr:B12-binding domain-containing radical SAM protein [bacterium]